MGNSWIRSKKVSPECVKTKNHSTGGSSSKHIALSRPFHIHALLRGVRNRARPGIGPARTAGEESAQTGRERRGATGNHKTHGLCSFSDEDDATDESTEPRGQEESARGDARAEHTSCSSSGPSLPRDCPADVSFSAPCPTEAHVPQRLWTCEGRPLLSTSVIRYNGSEEELMDCIEREYS